MTKDRIYLSTIAGDAVDLAKENGFGLEIAEYCTPWNMDERYEITHQKVQSKLQNIPSCLLHAPFNELFPCAIDPKARHLAACRYRQALAIAAEYGAKKVIIHSGYYEKMYYPVWFVNESVKFWREFMQSYTGSAIICLENVFEQDPRMLSDIVGQVGDSRLRMCLDIGHANAYSDAPLSEWLDCGGQLISHLHIHNNDGVSDRHDAIDCGSIDVAAFLREAEQKCKDFTCTLEVRQARPSCAALEKML